MKQDYFRVANVQELASPSNQEASAVVDAGPVPGDDSMIYIVKMKESRAGSTRSCEIYREIVQEDGKKYYQHLYEDNLGKPLLLDQANRTVYFRSNQRGLIEKVELGDRKEVQGVNLINAGIDHILGMFKLDIKVQDNTPGNRSYDLVLGSDAKSDSVLIISSDGKSSVQPSRSLSSILHPYDAIVQAEQMHSNIFVLLCFSVINDTYTLVCVRLDGMLFKKVDTYPFKKGQKVESFSISDVMVHRQPAGKVTANIIAAHSGSKLVQFSFGVGQAVDGRSIRKLHHTLNFRFKVASAISLSQSFVDSRGK